MYQGTLHSGTPKLAGTHLSIEPIDGWKIGVNRMMQFGGGPRKVDAGDVFDAFFDPAGNDNGDLAGGADNELGDQIASVTSTLKFDWGLPTELYFEYGGEDTKEHQNYQFGNIAYSLGLFLPRLTNNVSLRFEHTSMHSFWYKNYIYPTFGNTVNGYVIGHFAADQRLFGDSTPSEVNVLEFTFSESLSSFWKAKLTSISNESNFSAGFNYEYDDAIELQLSNTCQLDEHTLETTLTYGEDVFGDNYTWLSVAYFW